MCIWEHATQLVFTAAKGTNNSSVSSTHPFTTGICYIVLFDCLMKIPEAANKSKCQLQNRKRKCLEISTS